ncbi:MAG TPA: acyl-CoA carboxylase subunit epsilon [Streptosporangiaceae bacterium]|jgi:hypothetical protein
MPEDSAAAGAAPLLSVVRGEPDQAELAAVVVVLTERAGRAQSGGSTQRRPRLWSSPAASMRPRLAPGPGAWRASALP